jgi:hypothetical protein
MVILCRNGEPSMVLQVPNVRPPNLCHLCTSSHHISRLSFLSLSKCGASVKVHLSLKWTLSIVPRKSTRTLVTRTYASKKSEMVSNLEYVQNSNFKIMNKIISSLKVPLKTNILKSCTIKLTWSLSITLTSSSHIGYKSSTNEISNHVYNHLLHMKMK